MAVRYNVGGEPGCVRHVSKPSIPLAASALRVDQVRPPLVDLLTSWAARCDLHGHVMQCRTKAIAFEALGVAADWCPSCAEIRRLGIPLAELAARTAMVKSVPGLGLEIYIRAAGELERRATLALPETEITFYDALENAGREDVQSINNYTGGEQGPEGPRPGLATWYV